MRLKKSLPARRIAVANGNFRQAALDKQASTIHPLCGAPVVTSLNTLEGREYISRVIHSFERLLTKSSKYKACLVFVIPSYTIGSRKFLQYLREIILICKMQK